jgi:hypothetical protein
MPAPFWIEERTPAPGISRQFSLTDLLVGLTLCSIVFGTMYVMPPLFVACTVTLFLAALLLLVFTLSATCALAILLLLYAAWTLTAVLGRRAAGLIRGETPSTVPPAG